ncbi:hypothetical protein Sjap_021791 [Stephania japonica]|uniref:Uncharacterized protein n=1 Tax=Stephania japonica TaxID=461633 RepID=A0AAP0EWF9_9MAGN
MLGLEVSPADDDLHQTQVQVDQPIHEQNEGHVDEADHVSVPDQNNFIPQIETGEVNQHVNEAISKSAQTPPSKFQQQQLIQRLQAIEEDLEEVKVVIQQTSASLKMEVSAIMRNECNMLKEEIVNLFCQTMDKVEDRFSTRMVHNYRLVEY